MSLDPVIRQLEDEIERHGWEKIDFCRRIGVSTQVYNNWRHRGIPQSRRGAVAEVMGWDRDALVSEYRIAIPGQIAEPDVAGYDVRPGPHIRGMVPLISWVAAGAWNDAEDPYPPGNGDGEIACPASHGPRTFALRVEGDSMTASWGDSFPEGTIIFVDPDQRGGASNGSMVIARLEGESAVTFKKYVVDGGRHFLKPLNPQFPVISDPFRIIGKVIGSYRPIP